MSTTLDPEVARAFVAETGAKLDAVMAKLEATPPDQLVIRTVPAVTVGRGPAGDILPGGVAEEPAAAPAAERAARSDAEIFAHVGAFLDPTQMGPLFVSAPIRRRVFFGKYPTFAEVLSVEKVLGPMPDGASKETAALWNCASELAVAVKGFLFEHDPGIEHILAHPGDASKWPPLRPFSLANNRDPNLMSDIVDLWKQYLPWKLSVTPTEEELGKYYGLVS